MLVLVIITQEDGEGRGKEGLVLWKRYSSHATGLEEGALCSREGKWGFPGGTVAENLPANAGDTGSSPGLGGSHMPRSN